MVSQNQRKQVAQMEKHLSMPTPDADSTTELILFIENDGNLYKQMTVPIYKNLQKKYGTEKYDRRLALVSFRNLTDEGAKRYESGGVRRGPTPSYFTPAVRTWSAVRLLEDFESELDAGNRW
jgi:hypothetical protein